MKNLKIFALSIIFILTFSNSYSNNLRISYSRLEGSDIIFPGFFILLNSVSWDNSWRNDISGPGNSAPYNHDAVWLFAKFRKVNTSIWHPLKFNTNTPSQVIPQNCGLKISADSMGIFLFRNQNGTGTIDFQFFKLMVFHNNLINHSDRFDFQIFGIEMIYIPQDSFYVGGSTNSSVTGQFCANDNNSPFRITSEASITLGGLGPNSLNNHNAGGMSVPDDFDNTTTQTLPAEFPKGYESFYCMKYEVTSQQYVDFLNCLDVNQSALRFADVYGTERNSIRKTGNKFFTTAPDRANNFMSWADGAAYTDWAGLRPMTELEMEKISRGPLNPVTDEYAWGNTSVSQMTSFYGEDGSGTETSLPVNSNCNYNLVDGGTGQPINGPARVGISATSVSDRVTSGASYYGVMEMSGNCWERPVSVGSSEGRLFNGLHGNGVLDAAGNADVLNWPGFNSEGTGFRMGNWFRGTDRARVADRFFASTPLDNRTGHRGFRCVRSTNLIYYNE